MLNTYRQTSESPNMAASDPEHSAAVAGQYWTPQLGQEYLPGGYSQNYPSSMGQVPLTGTGLGLSTQPTPLEIPSAELDAYIDRYMRSVLRPEAFLAPSEPQEQSQTSFWPSNLHPGAGEIHPSTFQNLTSYPMWPSVPTTVPSGVPNTQQPSAGPPHTESGHQTGHHRFV